MAKAVRVTIDNSHLIDLLGIRDRNIQFYHAQIVHNTWRRPAMTRLYKSLEEDAFADGTIEQEDIFKAMQITLRECWVVAYEQDVRDCQLQ